MKMSIVARKMMMGPTFTERTKQKLDKLDKFFQADAECTVTLTKLPRDVLQVEATVRSGGMLFRAETTDEDANCAIDTLIDLLVRQIRKNKTRLERRLREGAFAAENGAEEEEAYRVVRRKSFPVRPMDVEEAILQMNLLGHQFFTFLNAETGGINVVYCRRDGDYGLLEPYSE
ncbi:MAG: ribosome-associated translation inhibitor RaiA [Ruminococcaceae bacterium]|nr:ribosome-associated translation inhibitor RaiA [Oscillospiraceae bacterium]